MRVLMGSRAAILARAGALCAGVLAGATPASAQPTPPDARAVGPVTSPAAAALPMKISVSPASTTQGSTGNAFTFKVSATGAVSGRLSLAVPSGWTAPQGTNSRGRGYVAIHRMTCTSAAPVGPISKGVILVSFKCAKGRGFSVTYGGTAASSKVTAPWTTGKYRYPAKAKIGSAGYRLLTAQPVVSVRPLHLVVWADKYAKKTLGTIEAVPPGGGTAKILATGQSPTAVTVQGRSVYWANATGTIDTVPLVGGTPATLASGLGFPVSVAADGTSVYWADSGSGAIKKVPLDGGTTTVLFSGMDVNFTPDPVAVTVDDSSVYWADNANGLIMKAPLDGSSYSVLATSQSGPVAIAVDGAYVYWADQTGGTIDRVPLSGGTVTVLASGQSGPDSIAVDGTSVYWADQTGGTIDKEPLSGETPTLLASGQSGPVSIAVDGTSVYWADQTGGTIDKVPLDGGSATTVARGQSAPLAIALTQ